MGLDFVHLTWILVNFKIVDDTLILEDPSIENLWAIKKVLRGFELSLGLRVNFQKSILIRINFDPTLLVLANKLPIVRHSFFLLSI